MRATWPLFNACHATSDDPTQVKPGKTRSTGYYARRMAPLVGSNGVVLAVDVQPEMIQMLAELAKKPGWRTSNRCWARWMT